MTNKKKILIIQKVHDKGMELINNHPNFDVEVTDDVTSTSKFGWLLINSIPLSWTFWIINIFFLLLININ